METLPPYIGILFGLTTLLAVLLFFLASGRSKTVLLILLGWMALQGFVSTTLFYTKTDTVPPRFMLLVVPPLLFILFLFLTGRGKKFLDHLDIRVLTLLHTVRIPVEIVLLLLSMNKVVPGLMTFEGRNFDILSGLSAPLILYLGFYRKNISKGVLLAWNFICLALLFNIVINAALSAPSPFQRFAFDQPNIAVLYFPFVWLPCCVVPLVLLSHLAAIRQLLKRP